ncbi:conserved hypothetical protein [Denitrovibrio acetiphilus DSM 12809]|uniref:DUF2905 domain-containing protein n=1 Tax=Denitrovibrio acetiphilus (strain DSM 12809 / NBRC 114555 / N2460) TaxID=522772 RepID=D4H2P7_DENA2|nr:DUF2905 domain-containing protein [Denitrovibrio acetiphilus]ADD67108.1 conserved hypothetical protein [Denitrovibrio acetiphilus DSM 12809]
MNFDFGKMLITVGIILIVAGVVVLLISKTGINFGRLPGDINIKKDNFSFHFPIVTSIIISIVITIILNIFFRK